MWKIIKLTPDNTSWQDLLNNWEKCNEERIKEQSARIIAENNLKYWRDEAMKFEKLMYEARSERDEYKKIVFY